MLNFQKKRVVIVVTILLIFLSSFIYAAISNEYNFSNKSKANAALGISTFAKKELINKKIILTKATLEIKGSSLDIISNTDFRVDAIKVSIKGKNTLNLKNVSLNIKDFKGTIRIKDASSIILDGSFLRIYNNEIELNEMKNAKIEIYGGKIKSKTLSFQSLKTITKGNIFIDDKISLDVDGEEITINRFDGEFMFSNYPNMLNLSGVVESLSINNQEYIVSVN